MADPANRREVEIKYRLPHAADHERLRQRLTALGAQPAPVQHEENVLFDSKRGDLGQRRAVLRIRSVNGGQGGMLTYKGTPTQTNGVKSREEIEVVIPGYRRGPGAAGRHRLHVGDQLPEAA